jgi:TRAP-type C4-dicarboxylate transport system substrate-binding protein
MTKNLICTAILSLGLASTAFAEKWDMPTPYGDGNHPTQVAISFAKEVSEKAGDKLDIKVHSGGSLIKHPEIHRAVKSRQVQIGEVFIGRLGNNDPVFKIDNLLFLATDFDSADISADSVVFAAVDDGGVALLMKAYSRTSRAIDPAL